MARTSKEFLKIRNTAFKRNKLIKEPSSGTVYASNGQMFFTVSGMPYSISITLDSPIFITSNLGVYFKINYKGNKIKIMNLFRKPWPDVLFTFEGKCNIKVASMLTYLGSVVVLNRTNISTEKNVENNQTKFEDEDEILLFDAYDQSVSTYIDKKGKGKGYVGTGFNFDIITESKTLQTQEILDEEQLSTQTTIENQKNKKQQKTTRFQKTLNVQKEQVSKINVKKSVNVKIEKTKPVKGGKY
tara:strand:+ start:372 stop:1100 length:729 start_codon:yes stop_codon:yes gene_type:complete